MRKSPAQIVSDWGKARAELKIESMTQSNIMLRRKEMYYWVAPEDAGILGGRRTGVDIAFASSSNAVFLTHKHRLYGLV